MRRALAERRELAHEHHLLVARHGSASASRIAPAIFAYAAGAERGESVRAQRVALGAED